MAKAKTPSQSWPAWLLQLLSLNRAASGGDVLYGKASMLEAEVEILAIKVADDFVTDDDDEKPIQVATDDPMNYLGELQSYLDEDEPMQTVKLPGYTGDWVLTIRPSVKHEKEE